MNKHNLNHIVFIPPNGLFKKQDFSILRISEWLSTNKNFKTTLIYIENNDITFVGLFDEIIKVKSQEELFNKLSFMKFNLLFNRSWMHSYYFSKHLVEKFNNVIINIKDWNFSTKEEYEFLFDDVKDFDSIEYIFKNAKYILSHFTNEQIKLWSEEYKIDMDKFIFFPEYCCESNFIDKKLEYKNIKLVYAGKIQKSNLPEQLFPAKSHLRSIKKITDKNISIDFVLPQREYETVISNKKDYIDFLYEDKFNNKFNIVKGKILSSKVLQMYHFGFFELETSGNNKLLYKYAVTSKFAFYLESATPMLVNKDFISITHLVRTHKLGIIISNEDLENIDNVLDITTEKYQEFIDNIKIFRKSFSYSTNDDQIKYIFK